MKITDVKGIGQSAAGKLGAAGIRSVEDLAEID
jgi:predicted flap endonuclease-1-like 5' DNA nuclease